MRTLADAASRSTALGRIGGGRTAASFRSCCLADSSILLPSLLTYLLHTFPRQHAPQILSPPPHRGQQRFRRSSAGSDPRRTRVGTASRFVSSLLPPWLRLGADGSVFTALYNALVALKATGYCSTQNAVRDVTKTSTRALLPSLPPQWTQTLLCAFFSCCDCDLDALQHFNQHSHLQCVFSSLTPFAMLVLTLGLTPFAASTVEAPTTTQTITASLVDSAQPPSWISANDCPFLGRLRPLTLPRPLLPSLLRERSTVLEYCNH